MSKIIPLRTTRDHIRPVLILLTSHRIDCLLLCLRSLERFTNLARFKKIYVVANAVSADHAAILHKFMHTSDNVEVIHCSPRGLVPAVNSVQNEILLRHADDVIIKMDEDVFVTPLWLEHLLEGYRFHRESKDVPIVSALSPVSPPGRFALDRFLKTQYPAEKAMYIGGTVEENWVYHRWVWEKVTGGELTGSWMASGPQPYFYPRFATLNCVVYDRRLIEAIIPLPTRIIPGGAASDGMLVNAALHTHQWKNAVVSKAIAHHYSFASCEEYLRSHVPLDTVWEYLQEIWREEQIKASGMTVRRFKVLPGAAGAAAN